jgi:hypothetical protein
MDVQSYLSGRPSELAAMVRTMRTVPHTDRIYGDDCTDDDFIIIGHAGQADAGKVDIVLVPDSEISGRRADELRESSVVVLRYNPAT